MHFIIFVAPMQPSKNVYDNELQMYKKIIDILDNRAQVTHERRVQDQRSENLSTLLQQLQHALLNLQQGDEVIQKANEASKLKLKPNDLPQNATNEIM